MFNEQTLTFIIQIIAVGIGAILSTSFLLLAKDIYLSEPNEYEHKRRERKLQIKKNNALAELFKKEKNK